MSILNQISRSLLKGPLYLMLFGFIFFGIGAGMTINQQIIGRYGLQTPGEVINLATRCDDDGCSYAPVVRFELQNGRTMSFDSSFSSNPPAYDVGDKVTVIYLPDAPEKADIKGGGKVLRIVFTIVGGAVIASGGAMFLRNMQTDFSVERRLDSP